MLLDSVVLILREVLEAAALVSVLLVLSRCMQQRFTWLGWSLLLGGIATFCFASSLETLTDALGGGGQEVANAGLQFAIYFLIMAILVTSATITRPPPAKPRCLVWLMILAVACAMTREGSEIFVFVSGFAASMEYRTAVFAGSLIGAGIGVSLGILLYSALRALAPKWCYRVSIALLCLIAAGMIMQATLLLEQIDWLPAGEPLWDSNPVIDEQSLAGELMYAVFGYEATPSAVQALLYGGSLLLIVLAYLLARAFRSRSDGP